MVCSFGDASVNHSTAVGAINTALNTAFRGIPVPIVFVCEDNGWGISVPTPRGWIEAAYGCASGSGYMSADGADTDASLATSRERRSAVARADRTPVFLHLRTVRFLGHAGSDAEISYRKPIRRRRRLRARPDPRRPRPRWSDRPGQHRSRCSPGTTSCAALVDDELARLGDVRPLTSAAEVMAPLSPRTPTPLPSGSRYASHRDPARSATLAESINATLSRRPSTATPARSVR